MFAKKDRNHPHVKVTRGKNILRLGFLTGK